MGRSRNRHRKPSPDTEILVHVGMPKTGTTAIQHALAASRGRLRDLGVLYPGHNVNHWSATNGVVSFHVLDPWQPPTTIPVKYWHELVNEVRETESRRVIISSELLAMATPDEVDTVLGDLGRCRILITVKPLEKMVPSLWQQRLRAGATSDLAPWCRNFLLGDTDTSDRLNQPTTLDIGTLIRRWGDRVGSHNVTVLVVPEDHDWLLRQFEHILGVPDHTLHLVGSEGANRGLTVEEALVVRALNNHLVASGFPTTDYWRTVRLPIEQMVKWRLPFPEESRIRAPVDVIELCRQRGAEHIRQLKDSGVTVIGDLDDLVPTAPIASVDHECSATATADAAAFLYCHLLAQQAIDKETVRPRDVRDWIPPIFMPSARRLAARLRSLRQG